MNRPLSRRDFLKVGSSAVAVAVAAAAASMGADGTGLYDGEIVDTHVHLWDLSKLKPPWVASATGRARAVLGHDHLLADYVEAARGLRITRGVYMEVDVAEEDQAREAKSVSDLCAAGGSPLVAAVISGRPAAAGFAAYLDPFRGNPFIKGVRQVLHRADMPARSCLEPAFVRGVRELGRRGLSFDLVLRNDQLDSGAELVDLCPGTRFVLDHCGNPHAGTAGLRAWEQGLARIAAAKNRDVVCKVSGVYGNVSDRAWPAERLAPLVRAVIDRFGWDRVMFAGDWPVVDLGSSLRGWVAAVKRIVAADRPEHQAGLFAGNARKFYALG